jgi:hypothetical protein
VRGSAVGVVLFLLLAGCAGGADSPGPAGTAAPEDRSKGVLQGIVVDDAIRPVAGASVQVTAPGVTLNGTTDEQGRFRFANLDSGTYIVEVSKAFYSPHQRAVVVIAGVQDPELARFQLVFEPSSVPYASVYKYEGFHECGLSSLRVCSNINIATWVVVCGRTGGLVCIGNVTGDRSLFFQIIDGTPTFLQAELVWEATSDTGRALSFVIGGGNESELNSGFAAGYNLTRGESPLMLRITNHEGEDSWCYRNVDDCEIPKTLNWTRIGTERALLGQVDAGPTHDIAGRGIGFSIQQKFTMITTVFYGYEPPDEWRFTDTGNPPPPPG